MKHSIAIALVSLSAAIFSVSTNALKPKSYPDTLIVPERAVIVTGDRDSNRNRQLVAVLYDASETHFSDPSAPRFLFFDRQGKVALGIGGYIKGTVQYDFNGSIDDGSDFTTYDIPVPFNPAHRNKFYGNANHSTIFLQLAGNSARFGFYQMFIQTNFTGNGATGYGLKLKQAYMKVGYVTAGLTNSTFVDGAAGTPVIDDEGPSGEMSAKNMLLRYAPRFNDHFSGAIGIEMPKASYTIDGTVDSAVDGTEPQATANAEKISQRVPDIPFYIQYEWGGGASHIRASGLLRALSYRNLVAGENKFQFAWAVQLSGKAVVNPMLTVFYQGAIGRGYAQYLNDLSGRGYDLIESATDPGRLVAPRMANYELGAKLSLTNKIFLSASYSQAHVFKTGYLGGDTYRYGRYISASAFYDIAPELRLAIEYLNGKRVDINNLSGHANRLIAMLQYTF